MHIHTHYPAACLRCTSARLRVGGGGRAMWVFLGITPPKRGGLERSPLQPHLLPGQVNRHLIDFLAGFARQRNHSPGDDCSEPHGLWDLVRVDLIPHSRQLEVHFRIELHVGLARLGRHSVEMRCDHVAKRSKVSGEGRGATRTASCRQILTGIGPMGTLPAQAPRLAVHIPHCGRPAPPGFKAGKSDQCCV